MLQPFDKLRGCKLAASEGEIGGGQVLSAAGLALPRLDWPLKCMTRAHGTPPRARREPKQCCMPGPSESIQPSSRETRSARRRLPWRHELLLVLLPTITVLAVVALVERFSQQRLLFASLASSAFLIYLDPLHGTNSARTLLIAQLGAAAHDRLRCCAPAGRGDRAFVRISRRPGRQSPPLCSRRRVGRAVDIARAKFSLDAGPRAARERVRP